MNCTKEEIVGLIRFFVRKNSRVPSQKDFRSSNGLPSYSYVYKHFGSLKAAIRQAGFVPRSSNVMKRRDNQDLIFKLRELGKEIGYIPAMKDVKQSKQCPNISTYLRRFGSFRESLDAADIKYGVCRMFIRTTLMRLVTLLLHLSERMREPWNIRN